MILTVTPSPALDLTWTVAALVPGETLRTGRGAHRAGGKGVNVSRVLTVMGHDTEALVPLGGETGDRFERELLDSGVQHSVLPVSAETRQTVTIVDESAAQSTVIAEEAPVLSPEEWTALVALVESRLERATALVVSGRISPTAPDDFVSRLVRSARTQGIPAVVDTSGGSLLEAARAGATLLKPNKAELAEATGESSVSDGIAVLLRLGAETVCVSLGEDGMAAATGRASPVHRAALRRPVRGNATGAGDAAVAALTVGLVAGESLDLMLRTAVLWSASAVTMPLAGEVDRSRFGTLEPDVLIADDGVRR